MTPSPLSRLLTAAGPGWRAVVLMLLAVSRGEAQTGTPFLSGINLDYLTCTNNSLYWKATCVLGNERSTIARAPAGGFATHTLFDQACDGWRVRSSNIAVNAAGTVFWATSDGRIVCLDADATPGTPPEVLASMETPGVFTRVHVAVSSNYVYWTETLGEFSENGAIFRVPVAGGNRALVKRLTSAGGGGAVSLFALGSPDPLRPGESILYQRSFGALIRSTETLVLPGQDPWPESPALTSFAGPCVMSNGRMYWMDLATPNQAVLRSFPLGRSGTATVHATLNLPPETLILDLAVDSQAFYWREIRSASGAIRRQYFAGGGPEVITGPIPGNDRIDLVSDGNWLYWHPNREEIRRLPVNAAAITWDLAATGMEIVQTIQGPANDVPLVEGKPTWVRGFGKVVSTNSGLISLQLHPMAVLHGTRNGQPLPDSPITYSAGDAIIRTSDHDRTQPGDGWWFRLLPEWCSGTVTLRLEVNRDGFVMDGQPSNNSVSRTVTFQRTLPVRLELYPLRVTNGTISSYRPAYQPLFDRAEAMLPIPWLSATWSGSVVIEEWNPPLPWDFGPYELSKSDDDSGWVLAKLWLRKATSRASAGARVHHGAFFHPFFGQAFKGIGRVDGDEFICNMALAPQNVINDPGGGVTLAHELAHNMNRRHVDCPAGTPDNTDNNYPYGCDITGTVVAYQGFDPLSRMFVPGTGTGDLMSYASRRWPSDYTWRKLIDVLDNSPRLPLARPPREAAGAGGMLLVMAVVPPSGPAEIAPAIPLAGADLEQSVTAAVGQLHDDVTWAILVRNAAGAVIRQVPAAFTPGTEPDSAIVLSALVPGDPEAASLELIRTAMPQVAVASLTGGGQPPAVSFTAPAAGTTAGDILPVAWNAVDPDGHPLRHTLRFSADGGATWQILADDLRTAELQVPTSRLAGRGAGQAQLEILTSDGLLTATARSAPFTILPKAPEAHVFFETVRGRNYAESGPSIAAGEMLIARGVASDVEDGEILPEAMKWSLDGPAGRTGTGREWSLTDLPPGDYTARLTVQDSTGLTTTAGRPFTVRPVAVPEVELPPVVDGVADDPAWGACHHPQFLRLADGSTATVRMVHSGNSLYVCLTGLPYGDGTGGRPAVSLSFDRNGNSTSATEPDDLQLSVTADGRRSSARGSGAGFQTDETTAFFTARIGGTPERWALEVAVPDSLLAGWDGRIIGMNVTLSGAGAGAPAVHWFRGAGAAGASPAAWAAVRLGSDPDDPRDSDMDQLADAWELAHFGDLSRDGTGDADGDGSPDRAEFAAGTDPLDPDSVFAIDSLSGTPEALTIRFPTVPGHIYTCEISTDLENFLPGDGELTGNGEPMEFHVPILPDAPSRFARIRVTRR